MLQELCQEFEQSGRVSRSGCPVKEQAVALINECGASMYYSRRTDLTVYAESLRAAQRLAQCRPLDRCRDYLGAYD